MWRIAINIRIQKFDANGSFGGVLWLLATGSFSVPYGVAVDGEGNFYVADTGNHRIEKFSTGQLLLTVWGSYGTGNGQFREPNCVAVDAQGNIYVTEPFRLQKFDGKGKFLAVLGTGYQGSGNGQFSYPQGAALDGQGQLYVADTGNNRIQMFDANGNFLMTWGSLWQRAMDSSIIPMQ